MFLFLTWDSCCWSMSKDDHFPIVSFVWRAFLFTVRFLLTHPVYVYSMILAIISHKHWQYNPPARQTSKGWSPYTAETMADNTADNTEMGQHNSRQGAAINTITPLVMLIKGGRCHAVGRSFKYISHRGDPRRLSPPCKPALYAATVIGR